MAPRFPTASLARTLLVALMCLLVAPRARAQKPNAATTEPRVDCSRAGPGRHEVILATGIRSIKPRPKAEDDDEKAASRELRGSLCESAGPDDAVHCRNAPCTLFLRSGTYEVEHGAADDACTSDVDIVGPARLVPTGNGTISMVALIIGGPSAITAYAALYSMDGQKVSDLTPHVVVALAALGLAITGAIVGAITEPDVDVLSLTEPPARTGKVTWTIAPSTEGAMVGVRMTF